MQRYSVSPAVLTAALSACACCPQLGAAQSRTRIAAEQAAAGDERVPTAPPSLLATAEEGLRATEIALGATEQAMARRASRQTTGP